MLQRRYCSEELSSCSTLWTRKAALSGASARTVLKTCVQLAVVSVLRNIDRRNSADRFQAAHAVGVRQAVAHVLARLLHVGLSAPAL